ncbi:MAG: methylated-DNA-[protein]-cysteine S-methyltransferase [Gammaproteobacteria bacterium]|jgi:methylated-DNA-[protein]-cysteine S-methyltransferase
MTIFIEAMDSPLGPIEIEASEDGVTRVEFVTQQSIEVNTNAHTTACKQQLQEYFNGNRREFDLALAPQGTDFQQLVWQQLSLIPFGISLCYGDIARRLDNPKAVRAVGKANGQNPISVIVPCHRVIGKDRSLTGYAGGVALKAWLLRHEGIYFSEQNDESQSDLFDSEA